MSGGGLTDYTGGLYQLRDWANTIELHNPTLSELLRDLYDLLHAYDYWLAGDYGSDDVEEAWKKFKVKWMDIDFEKIRPILMSRCVEIINSFEKGYRNGD